MRSARPSDVFILIFAGFCAIGFVMIGMGGDAMLWAGVASVVCCGAAMIALVLSRSKLTAQPFHKPLDVISFPALGRRDVLLDAERGAIEYRGRPISFDEIGEIELRDPFGTVLASSAVARERSAEGADGAFEKCRLFVRSKEKKELLEIPITAANGSALYGLLAALIPALCGKEDAGDKTAAEGSERGGSEDPPSA